MAMRASDGATAEPPRSTSAVAVFLLEVLEGHPGALRVLSPVTPDGAHQVAWQVTHLRHKLGQKLESVPFSVPGLGLTSLRLGFRPRVGVRGEASPAGGVVDRFLGLELVAPRGTALQYRWALEISEARSRRDPGETPSRLETPTIEAAFVAPRADGGAGAGDEEEAEERFEAAHGVLLEDCHAWLTFGEVMVRLAL